MYWDLNKNWDYGIKGRVGPAQVLFTVIWSSATCIKINGKIEPFLLCVSLLFLGLKIFVSITAIDSNAFCCTVTAPQMFLTEKSRHFHVSRNLETPKWRGGRFDQKNPNWFSYFHCLAFFGLVKVSRKSRKKFEIFVLWMSRKSRKKFDIFAPKKSNSKGSTEIRTRDFLVTFGCTSPRPTSQT